MRVVSRVPIVISAVFCGISALVGLLIFVHVNASTPTVYQVAIKEGHQAARLESKVWYLLSPELLLIFFFLWTAYYALTWKRFILHGSKIQEEFVRQYPAMSRLDMQVLFVVICCLICAFSAYNLWDLISRCEDVRGQV